ncbi:MAG: DUF4340 domain-containing protein [Deltaproteobacteria bacterium]|nr:DUF4340 domain-containing protein [Deltaproteobacteria bacterium]
MKRLLISLSLLAVVGATAFFYLRRKDPHAARTKVITSSKAPLAKLAPKDLDELEVTAPPEGAAAGSPVHVKVQRNDATSWKVVEPFADVASPDAMQQALEGLEFVQWKAEVADSVEAMGKLGCNDEKGVHVVARAKGQVLADLYVCGELDRARLASSSQIWEVSGLDRWRFAKASAKDWRHLVVVELPTQEIGRLRLTGAGGALDVSRPPPDDGGVPGQWKVEAAQPALASMGVDQDQLAQLASRLARLTALDVADGVSDADAGLAPPRATFEALTWGGGKGVKLLIGKAAGEGPEAGVYAKKDGDARLYRLPRDAADDLARSPIELQSRQLGPGASTAVRVDVQAGGETVSATRKDTGAPWVTSAKVDVGRLGGLVGQLEVLRASALATPQPTRKDAGLERPAASVTLTDAKGARTILRIGSAKDGSRYAARDGNPSIFLVDGATVEPLTRKPSESLK